MARSRTATSPRAKTKPRSVRATLQRKPGMRGDIFGHIPGIPVGRRWENRKAMSIACIHTPLIAGISGQKAIGAFSVVLAGEFADEDQGDTFTYIGSGGRAPGVRFGEQTCDQTFDNNLNQALRMSACRKKPVRVLRGYKLKSPHAPQTGFRYDGLYTVSNPRSEQGPTGFQVCKFDFTRCPDQDALPTGEGIPEIFRSDIDIRREMWQESRRQTARLAAGPGSSTSRSSPSLAGGSRDTPISFSDDDDASEDVENEEDVL
ncbi:hypothetical protein PHLGIDRAFT_26573 [Phlebiopsis gigantea 11061_1 CR5-6]|uniref:YDG domain-containing protein n=1 Tax=Phlebiopsis gigantea (strain 11061_1 CR5-6) TaxID=745531 RepID=A0A0C3ND65_PHLG1|nr:hypothetical protein PHLGIDRAFT_26573 [Phlebiopsis gigantea 11061_1 CR5-6]